MHAITALRGRTAGIARYCYGAFSIDCAFYLTLTGVPYKAIRLGAGSLTLGLLPAVWSIIYITGCGIAGRLSDRVSRIGMARVGTVILAIAILLMSLTPGLPGLFLGLAVAAIGLSLYWPALQAALADLDTPERLDAHIGWFNVSWSSGKSFGFLLGGTLLAAFGFGALFGVAIALVLGVAIFLRESPRARRGAHMHSAGGPAGEAGPRDAGLPDAAGLSGATLPDAARRRGFLLMAWIANGASYGAAATLNYHYPRLLGQLGLGSDLFGLFLGLVYLSQTVTFIVLIRTSRWHYRRAPLYAVQVGLALLLFVLPFVHLPWLAIVMSPLAGVEMGLVYFSSIYYSLHVASRPGRNTGYHEAVIGSGVLLVPPIGGWLATRFGRLEAPFLLCGGVILLAIVLEQILAVRGFTGGRPATAAAGNTGGGLAGGSRQGKILQEK